MFAEIRDSMTGGALIVGFLLVLIVAFHDIQEKQEAFDLAFRFLRFGAMYPLFGDLI